MSEHAYHWNLAPALDRRGRVASATMSGRRTNGTNRDFDGTLVGDPHHPGTGAGGVFVRDVRRLRRWEPRHAAPIAAIALCSALPWPRSRISHEVASPPGLHRTDQPVARFIRSGSVR